MEDSKDKVYAKDGCLIVSELGKCPFFEKDSSFVRLGYDEDCFFCKFSDFRKRDYIARLEREVHRGVLYSVCHNEKIKNQRHKIIFKQGDKNDS